MPRGPAEGLIFSFLIMFCIPFAPLTTIYQYVIRNDHVAILPHCYMMMKSAGYEMK
jgi:hypothetical protein